MSNIPDTPAKRIKRLRIDKGMSQEELAKLCGVSRMTIVHYEQDHASPRRKAQKLAVALSTTVEYILYGDTTPSSTPVVKYESDTTKTADDKSWELMEYIFRDEDKNVLKLLKKGRLTVDGKISNVDNGAIYDLDYDSCRLVRLAIKNALKEMIAGRQEVAKIQADEGATNDKATPEETPDSEESKSEETPDSEEPKNEEAANTKVRPSWSNLYN